MNSITITWTPCDHCGGCIPAQYTSGAAGFDLEVWPNWREFLARDAGIRCTLSDVPEFILPAGKTVLLDTGLRLEIPDGYAGLICPRSGLAARGVRIANAPGVIDSDYRGEIGILVTVDQDTLFTIGDRIAQLLIVEIPAVQWRIADWLAPTARGGGGFGSTGD